MKTPIIAGGGNSATGSTSGTPGNSMGSISGTPVGATPIGTVNGLTGTDRDAYTALTSLFDSYGLSSLAPDILSYIQNGYSADTISILLQNTSAYKQRFAANQARLKAGLPVLSPADYIATEDAYRQSMQAAGLPKGFYDSTDDFTNFIANDISPTEMNSRIQMASQATVTASPQYTQALQQMGLSSGDLTAYFLDPTKAAPLLQQQANTAAIGSEALARGLTFDQGYATRLAQAGFTQAQAAQGYSQISQEFAQFQQTAQQYGQNYTFGQEEQAVFQPGSGTAGSGNDIDAAQFQQRLASWQRANVSGTYGAASGGLSRHGGGQLS